MLKEILNAEIFNCVIYINNGMPIQGKRKTVCILV